MMIMNECQGYLGVGGGAKLIALERGRTRNPRYNATDCGYPNGMIPDRITVKGKSQLCGDAPRI